MRRGRRIDKSWWTKEKFSGFFFFCFKVSIEIILVEKFIKSNNEKKIRLMVESSSTRATEARHFVLYNICTIKLTPESGGGEERET